VPQNASPRAEVHMKFCDQLIGALIGGKFFLSQNESCWVLKKSNLLLRFHNYKLTFVTKFTLKKEARWFFENRVSKKNENGAEGTKISISCETAPLS
jgi:hypothetical protein